MMGQKSELVKYKIDALETTGDKISARAGLAPIARYLEATGITKLLSRRFSFLKKHEKGTPIRSFFHQVLTFFIDGTDLSMSRFDHIKNEPSHAGIIETKENYMISSHTAKRFFRGFSIVRVWLFRKVLKQLFLWRINIEKPKLIKIGLDTMVMDNNDAKTREGVEPTYKKVKGFQPLQVYWGRYIIDTIFRNGKAHSNHGNHVSRVITDLVRLIRKYYNPDVPIVFIADTGFFDEQLLLLGERLEVGIIVGGKMFKDMKNHIGTLKEDTFSEFHKGRKSWKYLEFKDQRQKWEKAWRLIYACPMTDENGQFILAFDRKDTVIYTNIGMENKITKILLQMESEAAQYVSAEAIINTYHFRACDELVNRALKNFGTERLPFKSFTSNAAYYYLMCIAFFMFESFKYDIDCPGIEITWYAETFRRKVLDIAGKIVCTARRIILKITKAIYERLDFSELWKKSIEVKKISPLPVA